jgi:hypothetical protein
MVPAQPNLLLHALALVEAPAGFTIVVARVKEASHTVSLGHTAVGEATRSANSKVMTADN